MNISEKNFKATRKGLNRQKPKMTLKPEITSGQSKMTSFCVITLNLPRVQFHVPKEETFSIPLTYIDGTRTPCANLDVLQEKRIDHHWNVDVDRNLSDSWTGFTRCTKWNEKPSKGYMWSRARLTKSQATSRLDHLWPEIWSGMSEAGQRKEKQWAVEKPKLVMRGN